MTPSLTKCLKKPLDFLFELIENQLKWAREALNWRTFEHYWWVFKIRVDLPLSRWPSLRFLLPHHGEVELGKENGPDWHSV